MSSNCGEKADPITINSCAVPVDEFAGVPNFCTRLGPSGDTYRNQYCGLMSTAGEWEIGRAHV